MLRSFAVRLVYGWGNVFFKSFGDHRGGVVNVANLAAHLRGCGAVVAGGVVFQARLWGEAAGWVDAL